jgi:hypothetical protein
LIVSDTSASRWRCLAGLLRSIKAWSGMEAACNLSRSYLSLLSAYAFLQSCVAECNDWTSNQRDGAHPARDHGFVFFLSRWYVCRCRLQSLHSQALRLSCRRHEQSSLSSARGLSQSRQVSPRNWLDSLWSPALRAIQSRCVGAREQQPWPSAVRQATRHHAPSEQPQFPAIAPAGA